MSRSNQVDSLLSGVKRGSISHLARLRENWPHSHSVECADAALSYLARERRRADIQQGDLEIIQLYTHTIVRFAMDFASRHTYPHMKRNLVDLLISRIDDTGNFDADESLRIYITGYCIQLMICMSYDPRLLHAIQASPVVSDFVVLTWAWIDPRTQLPIFLAEERLEAAISKGCIVNIAFQMYSKGSPAARARVLGLLDEYEPTEAADRLVRLATQRARAMALTCHKRLDSDPPLSLLET
ncbi:hypothetical protein FA13DRAFT_1008520 [Coprinellus micaceus]|uniref:Uncharacterized protein n=1 Tax=Coprinellus micaceus TaxID=71717 RepID=A0A4Y7SXZ3_COPMI|nr:hypothetical protein FA13DRAFT_1008520 [Coprinellus micaceus]